MRVIHARPVEIPRNLPPELEAERQQLTTEDAELELQRRLLARIPYDVRAQAVHEEQVYAHLARLSRLLERVYRGDGDRAN